MCHPVLAMSLHSSDIGEKFANLPVHVFRGYEKDMGPVCLKEEGVVTMSLCDSSLLWQHGRLQ